MGTADGTYIGTVVGNEVGVRVGAADGTADEFGHTTVGDEVVVLVELLVGGRL